MKDKTGKNIGTVKRESYNLKKRKIVIISIILLIIAILAVIVVQKSKNKPIYEIGESIKQEELEQKIKRKVTVLKVEEETIYGTIKFESTIENLEYVITPEENQIKLEKETRQLAIDYELQNKQEYIFKVKAKENEEEEIIIQIDKKDIPEVKIEQEAYATIKTQGVELKRIITINETEGYKTVYSLDNGENWEEYTKEVTTNQIPNAVIAQKVSIGEESKKELTIERYAKMPELAEDAIGIVAYDYNEETIELTNGIKYIKVEEAMEGFKIQVTGSYNVLFMQEDKKTSVSGTNSRNGDKIIIPEKTRYIGINGNIGEIKVVPSVQFKITYLGQTKIKVEAKTNGYSGDVTYEYCLGTNVKNTSKENIYQYIDLSPFYEYEIVVKATDNKRNTDTRKQKVKTLEINSSVVGFITSDKVDKNTQSLLHPTKIGNVQYVYEVVYLDKNNLPSQVSYNSNTNTYTITDNMQIGTATTDKMAVLKCDGNLKINSGVTITTSTYEVTTPTTGYVTKQKGLFICCMGTLTNNGTISQTARGTYNTPGENVYLWYNGNESYEYVPSYGGAGGAGRKNKPGQDGEDARQGSRETGGGGSGSSSGHSQTGAAGISGSGSQGTSYSGGSGGGRR